MKAARPYLWVGSIFAAVFVLFVLLAIAASPTALGAILKCMPFGWCYFLHRNIPQLAINWNLIGTGVVCSVLVLLVGHWLMRVTFPQLQRASADGRAPRRWPWCWTISMYCGMWLLFVITFGAAGVLRHTTWLIEYDQPWYQQRMHSYVQLRMVDMLLQQVLLDTDKDLESTRKTFAAEGSYWQGKSLMAEEFDVIFYGNSSNKVAAYLIIPRSSQLEGGRQFGASISGTNGLVRPISELQHTVAELDVLYPPH